MAEHEGLVRFQYLGAPRVVEVGPRSFQEISSCPEKYGRGQAVLVDEESETVYAAWLESEGPGDAEPEAEASADGGSEEPGLPAGTFIQRSGGGWYKAMNAEGQIGKSVRSREEAAALLMGG